MNHETAPRQPSPNWRRLAAIALAVALSACACSAGGSAADIQQATLVGMWGNSSGARLELTADHTASASGLDHALPLWPGCSAAITRNNWSFYQPVAGSDSLSIASDSVTHGQIIWIGLVDQEPPCDLQAVVRKDGHGFNLCLIWDLDETCTSRELLRKIPAPPHPTQAGLLTPP